MVTAAAACGKRWCAVARDVGGGGGGFIHATNEANESSRCGVASRDEMR